MKNAGVIVFSYFPSDPRVKRETDALVKKGMKVIVFCLRDKDEKKRELLNQVMVIRMNLQRKRSGRFRYLYEYFAFILWSTFMTAMYWSHYEFKLIHVHNMPDILVFSSIWPRLFGARVILDLHDPTPEVFMTKYNFNKKHPIIKFLVMLEKLSIKIADVVITPNIAFQELFISRSCPRKKIHIIMNTPTIEIFNSKQEPDRKPIYNLNLGFNLMYHGTIVERHGLDIALQSIAMLKNRIPGISFHVFGSGDGFVEKFLNLIHDLHLEDVVKYHGFVSLNKIARMIPRIDVGIIPNKLTPFTNINLPTRIFEYLCLKKPVVAPRTKGILDYFDDNSLFLFEPGSAKSLSETITKVYEDITKMNDVVEKGYDVYNNYRWNLQEKIFINLIDKK